MANPILIAAGIAKGAVTAVQVILLIPCVRLSLDRAEEYRQRAIDEVPEGPDHDRIVSAIDQIPLNPIPESVENFKRFFKGLWRQKIYTGITKDSIATKFLFVVVLVFIAWVTIHFTLAFLPQVVLVSIVIAIVYGLIKCSATCAKFWDWIKGKVSDWEAHLGGKTKEVVTVEYAFEKAHKGEV